MILKIAMTATIFMFLSVFIFGGITIKNITDESNKLFYKIKLGAAVIFTISLLIIISCAITAIWSI